jgi:hypothetical protein
MLKEITHRNIGTFEALVGVGVAELIFGGLGPRVLILGILIGVFYLAKRRFKGEFSLSQLGELFQDDAKVK